MSRRECEEDIHGRNGLDRVSVCRKEGLNEIACVKCAREGERVCIG
jgi:hypothetical protein